MVWPKGTKLRHIDALEKENRDRDNFSNEFSEKSF